MSTRRQFLATTSAAAAASAFPAALFAQFPVDVFSNANLGAYTQGLLTMANFQRYVGSEFKVFLPDRSAEVLTLLSVRDMTSPTPAVLPTAGASPQARAQTALLPRSTPVATSVSSQAFHLSFAVSSAALAQQAYTLDHGVLGRFAAFLVPGLSATGTNTCGASFNYLAAAGASPVVPQPRAPLPIQRFGTPLPLSAPQATPVLSAPLRAEELS